MENSCKSRTGITPHFLLPNSTRERLIPIFPDFIGRAIMMVSDDIQEYRVVQKNPDLIEVFVKVLAESHSLIQQRVHQSLIDSLIDLFERSHCSIPKILFLEYEVKTEHYQ
jgi:phenylacetate-coenzyme A ligase PaaK-like adenylate-forming protein